MLLEKMDAFFTARVNIYDEHMLNIAGCKEGYMKMAELLPADTKTLLDLGCGTGLELDEIFKINPRLEVTGVDLAQAMLDKLKEKHSDKSLTLINASYFDCDFGKEMYDAAVSFQTMHHFSHEDKLGLYTKINCALKKGGQYIECDYMLTTQEEEEFYCSENKRIRKKQGIADGDFYHYDTPCTISNQRKLLYEAGFKKAKRVWREENTTIIVAKK